MKAPTRKQIRQIYICIQTVRLCDKNVLLDFLADIIMFHEIYSPRSAEPLERETRGRASCE